MLAFGTALAANLVLGSLEISEPWAAGFGAALAVAAAVPLARCCARRSPSAARSPRCRGYVVALGADPSLVALSPFGPTQTLASRALQPAFGVARRARARGGGDAAEGAGVARGGARRRPGAVLAGASRFGADGGGTIALAVAFATLALVATERTRAGSRRGSRRSRPWWCCSPSMPAQADRVTSPALPAAAREGVAAALGERAALSWARATDRLWVAALVTARVLVLVLLVAPPAQRLPRAALGSPWQRLLDRGSRSSSTTPRSR